MQHPFWRNLLPRSRECINQFINIQVYEELVYYISVEFHFSDFSNLQIRKIVDSQLVTLSLSPNFLSLLAYKRSRLS